VRYPVDQLQVSVGRLLLEPEEADDAVDVDRQQRSLELRLGYQR
jgi:hypothetical protein